MSKGNMVTLSLLWPISPLSGYGDSADGPITGGIVLAGFGDVNAYTLAAATASAMQLNSPTGEILPGSSMEPPMTITSLALMNVFGSSAAAIAKFVNGPIAMRVTVSVGFSRRIWRISWDAWRLDGMNKFV